MNIRGALIHALENQNILSAFVKVLGTKIRSQQMSPWMLAKKNRVCWSIELDFQLPRVPKLSDKG